jgi:hypothetical protein
MAIENKEGISPDGDRGVFTEAADFGQSAGGAGDLRMSTLLLSNQVPCLSPACF